MRIAYIDCFSGISGDMTLAALIDAGASLKSIQTVIDTTGLPHVRLSITETYKNGFRAAHLRIDHPPEHAHRQLTDIVRLIERGEMTDNARNLAIAVFLRIARAEARVHGTPVEDVHFHEVGAIDSIADIVGVAVAWDQLKIDRSVASPVPVGMGQIQIAHGLVGLPAPATAELLKGIPIATCDIPAELTTPTGAAFLAELVDEFGPMPNMQVRDIGYGAGTRDLSQRPNLLRILIGDQIQIADPSEDRIVVMETNLDDISGEQMGFAAERLWNAGALDVFAIPIQMKKNRPGYLLTVLSGLDDRERLEKIIFEETGTLGVRHRVQRRSLLRRELIEVSTPWGIVRGKLAKLPDGTWEFSPEYDDCRQIALENSLRLAEVMRKVTEYYRIAVIEGHYVENPSKPTRGAVTNTPNASHDHGHEHCQSHDHSHSHDHSPGRGPGQHHDHA